MTLYEKFNDGDILYAGPSGANTGQSGLNLITQQINTNTAILGSSSSQLSGTQILEGNVFGMITELYSTLSKLGNSQSLIGSPYTLNNNNTIQYTLGMSNGKQSFGSVISGLKNSLVFSGTDFHWMNGLLITTDANNKAGNIQVAGSMQVYDSFDGGLSTTKWTSGVSTGAILKNDGDYEIFTGSCIAGGTGGNAYIVATELLTGRDAIAFYIDYATNSESNVIDFRIGGSSIDGLSEPIISFAGSKATRSTNFVQIHPLSNTLYMFNISDGTSLVKTIGSTISLTSSSKYCFYAYFQQALGGGDSRIGQSGEWKIKFVDATIGSPWTRRNDTITLQTIGSYVGGNISDAILYWNNNSLPAGTWLSGAISTNVNGSPWTFVQNGIPNQLPAGSVITAVFKMAGSGANSPTINCFGLTWSIIN